MLRTFEAAACDFRRMPTTAALRLVTRELGGLLSAIVFEWLAKLTTDVPTRFRALPDCRLMRPPGVTREEWVAGIEPPGGRLDC